MPGGNWEGIIAQPLKPEFFRQFELLPSRQFFELAEIGQRHLLNCAVPALRCQDSEKSFRSHLDATAALEAPAR